MTDYSRQNKYTVSIDHWSCNKLFGCVCLCMWTQLFAPEIIQYIVLECVHNLKLLLHTQSSKDFICSAGAFAQNKIITAINAHTHSEVASLSVFCPLSAVVLLCCHMMRFESSYEMILYIKPPTRDQMSNRDFSQHPLMSPDNHVHVTLETLVNNNPIMVKCQGFLLWFMCRGGRPRLR